MSTKRETDFEREKPRAFVVPRAILHQAAEPDHGDFLHAHDRLAQRCALAMIALGDPQAPGHYTTAKISDVVRLLDGEPNEALRRFPGKRFHDVMRALVQLLTRKFAISVSRYDKRIRARRSERTVVTFLSHMEIHYADGATGTENIGTAERPVLIIPGRRPIGISFRLGTELAEELTRRRGVTVPGAIHAQLRHLRRDAAAIRFAMWLARQRDAALQRNAGWLFEHFCAGGKHETKTAMSARVDAVLAKLTAVGLLAAVTRHDYQPGSGHTGQYLTLHRRSGVHGAARMHDPGNPDGGNVASPAGRVCVPCGEALRPLGGEPGPQPTRVAQENGAPALYDLLRRSIGTGDAPHRARPCTGKRLRRPPRAPVPELAPSAAPCVTCTSTSGTAARTPPVLLHLADNAIVTRTLPGRTPEALWPWCSPARRFAGAVRHPGSTSSAQTLLAGGLPI